MRTLVLSFQGFFQMRMATDPDPSDDPRGVSGYTYALPGEPDLDGIVHLQPYEDGVWERAFGPDHAPGPRVGVNVYDARIDGTFVPDIIGARLSMPGLRMVERNGLVVRNDYFAVDPVRAILTNGCVRVLDREDFLDGKSFAFPITDATSEMLKRRQPKKFVGGSDEAARANGLPNGQPDTLLADRKARRENLVALLAKTTDPVERSALETRIQQLDLLHQWWNISVTPRPVDRRASSLGWQFTGWSVGLNGTVRSNHLQADTSQEWPLEFWMGGWDGDALTAYMRGTWTIPLL
ncbi:MAG: hypothetical protein ACXWUG_13260 [Polyangiales bacterium]